MSGHGETGPSPTGWILGGLVGGLLGGVAGLILVVSSWNAGDVSGLRYFIQLVQQAFFGFLVGLVPGLLLGGVMGWHGSIFGNASERGSAAPLWGVIAALTFGMAIGPVAFGVVGLWAGHLVDTLMLGLGFGPVLALLGWQTGFWLGDTRKMRHSSSH